MAQVKIITTRSIPSSDRARIGQADYLVVYQVDNNPMQTVFIKKDKPTEQEILAAIKESEAHAAAIAGKTYTI